jgi:hypothetical protein
MHYRLLGSWGPDVSVLGLCCMGMSDFYGPTDRTDSITTIHSALDAGITPIDTGDFYGMGQNEILIRDALCSRTREQVLISVKFGALRDPAGGWSGYDCRPAAVKNYVTYSLRRPKSWLGWKDSNLRMAGSKPVHKLHKNSNLLISGSEASPRIPSIPHSSHQSGHQTRLALRPPSWAPDDTRWPFPSGRFHSHLMRCLPSGNFAENPRFDTEKAILQPTIASRGPGLRHYVVQCSTCCADDT